MYCPSCRTQERTHACPESPMQPKSTILLGRMRQGPVNEGQDGADGMYREPERAQRGVRGREGPGEAWSSLLIGTPCSWISLEGHTYLPNGKGPVKSLHYQTHLVFAPDKMTASLHGEWSPWLIVKENKSHRSGIRCHLLAGGEKYERLCTQMIKRWEKVKVYYQYLFKKDAVRQCQPKIATSTYLWWFWPFILTKSDRIAHFHTSCWMYFFFWFIHIWA